MSTTAEPSPADKYEYTPGPPANFLDTPVPGWGPPVKPPLRCFADLSDRPQQWLWPGRIPRGALTLVCGEAGRGKSLVTLAMTARVTTGQPWPDGGGAAEVGDVLLFSAEDSITRTVRSRLVAHGADLTRVHYLNSGLWSDSHEDAYVPNERNSICVGTAFGAVPTRAFHALRRDADHLRTALEALPNCRLVVIDPMPAYLRLYDLVDVEEARLYLAPLTAFADRTGAAVIAVLHRDHTIRTAPGRRQDPLRILADIARAIYLIGPAPDDPRRRLMIPLKNNLGDASTAVAFHVEEAPNGAARIQWSPEPVELTGDDFSHSAAADDRPRPRLTELDRAIAWLQGALAGGPMPSRELIECALRAGIRERCLARARARLGVVAANDQKIGGRWQCSLPQPNQPDHRDCQNSDLAASAASAASLKLDEFREPIVAVP